jgi:hypothetical protein
MKRTAHTRILRVAIASRLARIEAEQEGFDPIASRIIASDAAAHMRLGHSPGYSIARALASGHAWLRVPHGPTGEAFA